MCGSLFTKLSVIYITFVAVKNWRQRSTECKESLKLLVNWLRTMRLYFVQGLFKLVTLFMPFFIIVRWSIRFLWARLTWHQLSNQPLMALVQKSAPCRSLPYKLTLTCTRSGRGQVEPPKSSGKSPARVGYCLRLSWLYETLDVVVVVATILIFYLFDFEKTLQKQSYR